VHVLASTALLLFSIRKLICVQIAWQRLVFLVICCPTVWPAAAFLRFSPPWLRTTPSSTPIESPPETAVNIVSATTLLSFRNCFTALLPRNSYPMRLIFREASPAYLILFHSPQPSHFPDSIFNGWLPPPVPPALEGRYVFPV